MTEVLNDDIKELRRFIDQRYESLGRQFHDVAVDLAGLRGELKVTFRMVKWASASLVTALLTCGVAGIWWAASLNQKVVDLDTRIDERFKASDTRIDERFKASDARLDRIENAINRLIEQGRPAQPASNVEMAPPKP